MTKTMRWLALALVMVMMCAGMQMVAFASVESSEDETSTEESTAADESSEDAAEAEDETAGDDEEAAPATDGVNADTTTTANPSTGSGTMPAALGAAALVLIGASAYPMLKKAKK